MASDMTALAEFIARVQEGTRVEVYGHGANEGRRTGTVTQLSDNLYGSGKPGCIHTLDKPTYSQGRRFTSGYITWPVESDDFEIVGDTLREYRYSAYTGGRALSVEITISTPLT